MMAGPLQPFAMGDTLRYRRQGSHDDRTAVNIWRPVAPELDGAASDPDAVARAARHYHVIRPWRVARGKPTAAGSDAQPACGVRRLLRWQGGTRSDIYLPDSGARICRVQRGLSCGSCRSYLQTFR
jgi:hypothetical protein